ncbi:MAG: HNH endonuclease [Acidobacteriota bacterium]|nr:HNH endonuclease [Acidobacteriota bacterium]
MLRRKPSEKQKQQVKKRAANICEYCRSQADFSSQPFSIEHIIPFVHGGKTVLSNLAFACQGCNGHKYTLTEGRDPITRKAASLFNPRKQKWSEHFTWNDDFTLIIGKTPVGRATVETLQLNRLGCINLRRALFVFGKHPPKED